MFIITSEASSSFMQGKAGSSSADTSSTQPELISLDKLTAQQLIKAAFDSGEPVCSTSVTGCGNTSETFFKKNF